MSRQENKRIVQDASPKLPREMIDQIYLYIPFTTDDYVDFCLPEPISGEHQSCVKEDLFVNIKLSELSRRIDQLHYPMEVFLPIIYYILKHPNLEGYPQTHLFFNTLRYFYYPTNYIINEEMVTLAILNDNFPALDVFNKEPFPEERNQNMMSDIRQTIIDQNKMTGIIQQLLDGKKYKMINKLLTEDYVEHRESTFFRLDMFTKAQKKQILTVPIKFSLPWDLEHILEKRVPFLSFHSVNKILLFSQITSPKESIGSVENVSIMHDWERLLDDLFDLEPFFNHALEWDPSYEMILQMINDTEVTDETIRWLFIIIITTCNNDAEPNYYALGVLDRQVCIHIALIFQAILLRLTIANTSPEDKKQKAIYFLGIWRLFSFIGIRIAEMNQDTKRLYNELVGPEESLV